MDNGSDLDIVNQVQEWIGLQLNTNGFSRIIYFMGCAMDLYRMKDSKIEVCFFLDSDTVTKEGGFLESIVTFGIR